jgi:hypothetical protein
MNQKPFHAPSESAAHHADRIQVARGQSTSAVEHLFVPGFPCGCAVMCLALFSDHGHTLVYDGPSHIVSVCDEHAQQFACVETVAGAGLDNVEALYAELMHSHGHGATMACGCVLVWHSDDRETAKTGTVNAAPIEHPHFTKRCIDHAHLVDAEEHHACVLAAHADPSA